MTTRVAHDHFDSGEGKDCPGAKVHKAFHRVGMAHHTFKAAQHEKLHKAHSAMCDSAKAGAFDLGGDRKKVDTPTLTKADPVVAAFWNRYWPAVKDLDS